MIKRFFSVLVLTSGLLTFPFSCKDDEQEVTNSDEDNVDWYVAADSSSLNLIDKYWNSTKNCFNNSSNNSSSFEFHYWPQGHALDVLVDAYNRTSDDYYLTYINNWYEGVNIQNGNTFLNYYYDDMEWNALAMLRAYNATGEEKFKTSALEVWENIKTGWNDDAGGGVAWNKAYETKNACSNGPASILAARLYQQFGTEDNKEWAEKIYNWEKETLFISSGGYVYDNIDCSTGSITTWIFTYNQGTFIGTAIELYNITGEKVYLNDAIKATDYTLNSLINATDNILKDEGSGDAGLFKGVFIRYFTQLILHPDLKESTKQRYVQFLKYNAETLWTEGCNKRDLLFGTYWKEIPGDDVDLKTHLSGCMLIEAAALLEASDLL